MTATFAIVGKGYFELHLRYTEKAWRVKGIVDGPHLQCSTYGVEAHGTERLAELGRIGTTCLGHTTRNNVHGIVSKHSPVVGILIFVRLAVLLDELLGPIRCQRIERRARAQPWTPSGMSLPSDM